MEFLKNFLGNKSGKDFDYSVKKQVFVLVAFVCWVSPVYMMLASKMEFDKVLDYMLYAGPAWAAIYAGGKVGEIAVSKKK